MTISTVDKPSARKVDLSTTVTAAKRVGNGCSGQWVEGVRVTPAILLEVISVITRGRNPVTIEREYALGNTLTLLRRFQTNAPRLTIGLFPGGLELTGYFHQVTADAQLVRRCTTRSTA